MSHIAYKLEWEVWEGKSHDVVCRIVEFPGWGTNTRLANIQPLFEPSEPVHFDTNFALLEDVPDYPNNTANWPIMSHRMLDVLLSVREFPYHAIPVTLVQDTVDVDIRYDADGRPKPEYSKTDYVAVQLTSYADVFDAERSECSPYPFAWAANSRGIVDKLVMRVPPEGLPPLFRIEETAIPIFVSAEARAALESAGIRGPVYWPHKQN